MRGHITERRPGVWRLTVSAGFDEAGRRQRVTRTIQGGRRDAERALTALLNELDMGTLADGRQPLAAYLEREWLPAVAKVSKRGRPLSPTTAQRYLDSVRHVSKVIGAVRLSEVRPSTLSECGTSCSRRGSALRRCPACSGCSRRPSAERRRGDSSAGTLPHPSSCTDRSASGRPSR
jgi:hypothetical protein